MVEFQTIKAEEITFGNRNFIEVARKKAITEEGENEFIAVSRGFFAPDGSKRFKKSFTIPDEQTVVDFILKNIKEMSVGGKAAAPAEKTEKKATKKKSTKKAAAAEESKEAEYNKGDEEAAE